MGQHHVLICDLPKKKNQYLHGPPCRDNRNYGVPWPGHDANVFIPIASVQGIEDDEEYVPFRFILRSYTLHKLLRHEVHVFRNWHE